jgi:phospholipase C
VVEGHDRTYTWDTAATGGKYAFSVYGPDGFVTSFAGTVIPSGHNAGRVPGVAATQLRRRALAIRLTLSNDGHQDVVFTLTPKDHAGHQRSVRVAAGHPKTVDWPADIDGYYDVTIAANSGDGFMRRYAGRIS